MTPQPDPLPSTAVSDARPAPRLGAALVTGWLRPTLAVLLLAGVAALICGMVPVGPGWLGEVGSVVVATVHVTALSARTGGRPLVFGALTAAVGAGVLVADLDWLRTGAAVGVCAVSAVLGVMATVPAVTYLSAVREVLVAMAIAAVGALATVGFEPVIRVDRFEGATFVLALLGAFGVVYRLGAGLHGLGRRGMVTVLVGGVVLLATVLYAELLRRYGTPTLVENLLDAVRWSREHLGAFPRPIAALLGVPALVYGTHMRARRRQGWWVCAFGVAATTACANALANPAIALEEAVLSVLYGVVIGVVIGYGIIRLDLFLTGASRGTRGRRSRAAEQATALRPEPARHRALL